MSAPIILASQSPRRTSILSSLGIQHTIEVADIDETPLGDELPRQNAIRLALEKAAAIGRVEKGCVILAADTVVGVGRRILPKTETEDEARLCLDLLSGRAHRVCTGVCVIGVDGNITQRLSETRLKMKCLSLDEKKTISTAGSGAAKQVDTVFKASRARLFPL